MKDVNGIKIKEGDLCFYSEMPYDNYADTIGIINKINGELKFIGKITRVYNQLANKYLNDFSIVEEDINPVGFEFHRKDGDRLLDLVIVSDIEFNIDWIKNNCNKLHKHFNN